MLAGLWQCPQVLVLKSLNLEHCDILSYKLYLLLMRQYVPENDVHLQAIPRVGEGIAWHGNYSSLQTACPKTLSTFPSLRLRVLQMIPFVTVNYPRLKTRKIKRKNLLNGGEYTTRREPEVVYSLDNRLYPQSTIIYRIWSWLIEGIEGRDVRPSTATSTLLTHAFWKGMRMEVDRVLSWG